MRILHRVPRLWRNLFDQRRLDQDLDDELRSYQELLADEKRGVADPAERRRQAVLEMGGIEQIKEQVREVRMGFSFDTLVRDARLAFRTLIHQPGFSLTVLTLLTVGIAGTTAIFSVYHGLYFRPLPFEESERLVNLDEKAPQWNLERTGVAYPDFHAWREQNQSFESMAVVKSREQQLSDEDGAQTLRGAVATYDLLRVLRVTPHLGRWFRPEEDRPNGPPVTVIGYALWQARFGGSPGVLGRIIKLNGQSREIVGVLPPAVDFPNRTEIWLPLALDERNTSGWFLEGIARLKPGESIARAQEDLLRVHRGMIESHEANKITSPTVYPLRDWYVGNYRDATTVLLGAVCLVLLIACANIAGIMLARGSTRTREMGIRAALGAPRLRILRQLMTESLLLGALGGVLGTLLGFQSLRILLALLPPDQLPGWVRFDLDGRFLLFCLLVSIGSAVLAGLWPAWSASRADVRAGLQEGGPRASESAGQRRSLKALIVTEIALAAVLLTSAGLLIQAFHSLQRMDYGFRADSVFTYQVGLPPLKYPKREQAAAFVAELLTRHRALPGVSSAAVTSATPLGGHSGVFFETEHASPRRPGDPTPVTLLRTVTPGYVEAMGMELRSGRTFTSDDGRSPGTATALVNETFAKLHWPGQNPLGKRIRNPDGEQPWISIVGVLADVKDYGLDQPVRPSVYLPWALNGGNFFAVVVRTTVNPTSLTNAFREDLRRLDPDLSIIRPTTMSQRLHESMWLRRTYSWLVAVFAALAVVLVVSGLYGVISYTVNQRRRELAIRAALGAGQSRLLRGVLLDTLLMTGLGLSVGLVCGWWSSRLFASLLIGVQPTDPAAYLAASAIAGTVALAAGLLPAIRASRLDPVTALRMD